MTAINHALTGALIGLAVANPELAIPLAFLSHFALDAIPHYDPPGTTDEKRMNHPQFFFGQLIGGAILCFLLVLLLFVARPGHWLLAAICAFAGASPDLLSLPRYLNVKRGGKDIKHRNWFWRFHSRIQWKTGPKLIVLEAGWFIGGCLLLSWYL